MDQERTFHKSAECGGRAGSFCLRGNFKFVAVVGVLRVSLLRTFGGDITCILTYVGSNIELAFVAVAGVLGGSAFSS